MLPYNIIGQAKRIVLAYVARHAPDVVALEKPLAIATRRASLLTVIVQELRARSRELGLAVRELGPTQVRHVVAGNPKATKTDVARELVALGYTELQAKLPRRPRRSALGLHPRDRYWLHVFDALAVARAARGSRGDATLRGARAR